MPQDLSGRNDAQSTLPYALDYAAHKFRVFSLHTPIFQSDGTALCSCGRSDCRSVGKHPIGSIVPHGLKDASRDASVIKRWWARAPNANVGVDPTSAGAVVFDVDPRHGGDVSLAQLEILHGPLPMTWRVRTGGGGDHYYFRHPDGAPIPCSNSRVGPGLDIKAQGGSVAGVGSLHASGARYAWCVGHQPTEIALAPMPDWLVSLARGAEYGVQPWRDWRELVSNPVPEGQRNSTIARLYGHLLARNVDAITACELILAWNLHRCTPPLSTDEVLQICRSIAGRELARRSRRG